MHDHAAVIQWATETSQARTAVGEASTAVADACRYAATHLGPDRTTPLNAAGVQLEAALNGMRTIPAPPVAVLGTMYAGATKHLRTAAGLAQTIDMSDAQAPENLANAFDLGSEAWCRATDEMLVSAGLPPLGNDGLIN